MAINYLNSLDLNKNEILQGVIENQPNDAAAGASPVEGQLYFNTTNHVLMQYNGTSWEEAGGGVETLTTTDGTYIDLTPNSATAGAVTVTADLSAADGTPAIGKRFLTKDNTWAVPIISDQNTTYTLPVSAGTAVAGHSVADIDLTAGGSGSGIASKVTFAGKNDNILITETTLNNGVVNIALTDNVTIADSLTVTQDASIGNDLSVTGTSSLQGNVTAGNELTVSGDLTVTSDAFFNGTAFDVNANTAIDFGANKLTNVADPTNPQEAATKQYVDDATVGGLVYQGGYNASTNTPDLDSASSIAVEKGWTYTVTVAGLFFTEQVRVGDVLIAEVDQAVGAGALANWTTVQNNIDLASLTQVGIGNVVPGGAIDVSYSSGTATVSVEDSTASNKGAVIVAAATSDDLLGINVAYSGGTATVGLNIDNGLAEAALPSSPSDIFIPYLDDTSSENHKVQASDLANKINSSTSKTGTIAAGSLSGTVTHAFGINTLVQTIDASGNTVFCDITRTATTSVATISVAEATAITILVQKIG